MSYAAFGQQSVSSCLQDADCPGTGYICCRGGCHRPTEDACKNVSLIKAGWTRCPPNATFHRVDGDCSCNPGYTYIKSSESPWGHACLKPGQTVEEATKTDAGIGAGVALLAGAALLFALV